MEAEGAQTFRDRVILRDGGGRHDDVHVKCWPDIGRGRIGDQQSSRASAHEDELVSEIAEHPRSTDQKLAIFIGHSISLNRSRSCSSAIFRSRARPSRSASAMASNSYNPG